MKTKIIIGALIIIAIVFYGGYKYGQSKSAVSPFGQSNFAGGGLARRSGSGGGGSLTRGEIIKKDAESLTVALPNNNGSKIVFYSTSTEVQKMTAGSPADLVVGKTVMVTGSANSDGSVTANSVQLR